MSLSLIVEKSMGFLMTLRYPGTDLELTGVRNGPASWWLSSSAKSILINQINDIWFICTSTFNYFCRDSGCGTVPAHGQVFTVISGGFGLLHTRWTLLLCWVWGRILLCPSLFYFLWHFFGSAVGAAWLGLRVVSGYRCFPVAFGLGRFPQASARAVHGLLGLQGLTARLHRAKMVQWGNKISKHKPKTLIPSLLQLRCSFGSI